MRCQSKVYFMTIPEHAIREGHSTLWWLDCAILGNFIACRPKAALLFWLFSDFICGVPLFIVILVICKYKNK